MTGNAKLEGILKRRDIARAYEAHEGSFADLAARFHASTRTVQQAVRQGSSYWQDEADRFTASIVRGPMVRWETIIVMLHPYRATAGEAGGFIAEVDGQAEPIKVPGSSIAAVTNRFGAEGWEPVAVLPFAGDKHQVMFKRPAGFTGRTKAAKMLVPGE